NTISSTAGGRGTLTGAGTSVNATAGAAAPAARNTRRHQRSVLSGIPRCSPNARSRNPLRCHCANTRRISWARAELVDPILPMAAFLCTHSALPARSPGRCLWSLAYGILQQNLIFQRAVAALDLALGHGVIRFAPGVSHLVFCQPGSQLAGEIRWSVVAQQPRSVPDPDAL